MTERKKLLSDILNGSAGNTFKKRWDSTQAAQDLAPLPPGEYLCRVLSGELFTSKNGTPGFKLTLEVSEGEHEGRRAWHDLWLTPAALPMSKRDLLKLQIDTPEKLEQPLPPGILVRVRLALRRGDDGQEGNRVTRFEFAGIEKGDAFEPTADDAGAAESEPADLDADLFPPTADNAAGPYQGDRR